MSKVLLLRKKKQIREISRIHGFIGRVAGMTCSLCLPHTLSLFRRHTVGGKVGVAMEAQHARWVRGRGIMAAPPCRAQHVDGGDYGRQLWHPAWPQLYTTQTHHQPVPHCCHSPLLEHAAWVIHTPARTHRYNSSSWNAAWLIVWLWCCFMKETFLDTVKSEFYSVIKHNFVILVMPFVFKTETESH